MLRTIKKGESGSGMGVRRSSSLSSSRPCHTKPANWIVGKLQVPEHHCRHSYSGYIKPTSLSPGNDAA